MLPTPTCIKADPRATMISLVQPMPRKCVRHIRKGNTVVSSMDFKYVTDIPLCCSLSYTAAITGSTNMEMCWGRRVKEEEKKREIRAEK